MEISFDDTKAFWGEHQEAMRQKAPLWLNYIPRSDEFKAYLFYMMERLKACRRVLKQTGSIYLHCDYRASHYLKMVMDEIFGYENLVNEVIWSYRGTSAPRKGFKKKHDILLYYSKASDFYFNPREAGEPMTEKTKRKFTMVDERDRRYKHYRHPDGTYHRQYFDETKLTRLTDVWEISTIQSWKEKVGYPTQKPEALLERIIKASSNEGDLVLDPFCGCGTAVIVAHKLDRQWVGIDINKEAWETILKRANQPSFYQWLNSFKKATYVSRNLDEVMAMNPHEFENWVNQYYRAIKPYPDEYVDGITKEGIPIQSRTTKGGVDSPEIHAFHSAIQFHPKLSPNIKQGIFASQNGFSDRARKAVNMIEAKDGMVIKLEQPEDILKLV